MGARHRAATVLAAGMLAVVAAGCSPALRADGHQLAAADQPLQQALERVKHDNDAGIQNNSITVSDATHCFYTRPAPDSDDITDTVACGPVRRIGRSDTQVWDTYRLGFSHNADGDTTARVVAPLQQGVTEDAAGLIAPDNSAPAPVSEVPKPQVPQTAVADHAVALPADEAPVGLRFSELHRPAELITPTATIEVIAQARPATVPTALVAGQHDPAGPAPYYRPAGGQTLYAYRVRISDPVQADVPASTTFDGAAADRSTALSLVLSGHRTVDISGTIGANQTAGTGAGNGSHTLTLACRTRKDAGSGCRPQRQDLVILATVPSADAIGLRATVAGGHQTVDLPGGVLSTDVSRLDYDRADVTASVDRRLQAGPVAVPAASGPAVKVGWSVHVDSATLAAFDPSRGWAPKGRAWLLVSTSGYAATDHGRRVAVDRGSSLRLIIDGRPVDPAGPTSHELAAHRPAAHPVTDLVRAFDVPDNLTTATLVFRPTGRVVSGGRSGGYSAGPAATVDIRLPR